MPKTEFSRRDFLKRNALTGLGIALGAAVPSVASAEKIDLADDPRQSTPLRISTFDIDATPPVGSMLAYDPMIASWDLGLRAKGIVLQGTDKPVVICAIDWIGIANESYDVFKQTLADAVGTDPQRVAVHTVHQHDAPICDFSAEKYLNEAGIDSQSFNGDFAREFLIRLKTAVKESWENAQPITRMGIGEAQVYRVASNRRIVGEDGKVGTMRASSCKDPELRDKPEGLIDPTVSLISLWNGETPVAAITFYAVHPQSYYLTQIANPDFPGVARFYRQLALPDVLHVHFNGAGGNIAAGKYNDGAHENRMILAQRLADGMERAWKNSVIVPVSVKDVRWETESVLLPPAGNIVPEIEKQLKNADQRFLTNNMTKFIWLKRRLSGKAIDISCLHLGKARMLFVPGELFVEYQLAAKAFRPDLSISMAAYGDYGPFYIGTKEAYAQGGYEIISSPVTENAEDILMTAVRKLLHDKK